LVEWVCLYAPSARQILLVCSTIIASFGKEYFRLADEILQIK
jgi:hypothetical protein